MTQYEKELDSSLSDITLTSSINGKIEDRDKNNMYFKISGKNIYTNKVYNIIIPIITSIGSLGSPPDISCPVISQPSTTVKGEGKVDVIVKDVDNDFKQLCYYNYLEESNTWDEAKPVCTTGINGDVVSITNAKSKKIKVYAEDKESNESDRIECTTNIIDEPVGSAPTISCPDNTKNNTNSKPWTNKRGQGKVDIKITDNDGDFTELCYYNYSLTSDNWDEANTTCINNTNGNKTNTISITDAQTYMIRVYAKDKGGNITGPTQCATNVDTLPPYTSFAYLPMRNGEVIWSRLDTTNLVGVDTNTCCYVDYDIGEPVCDAIKTNTLEAQECSIVFIKDSGSRTSTNHLFYVYDQSGDGKRDGKSDWHSWDYYSYQDDKIASEYKNCTQDTYGNWICDVKKTHLSSSNKSVIVGHDLAGNDSPNKLTLYVSYK